MTSVDVGAPATARFSGAIVGRSDPGYDQLRRVWNAMIDRRPALITRCNHAGDVAVVVELARESGLPLSVYGGGHSFPGHSVCDDGLMIDLRPMKRIEIDPESRTCRAEAGLTWGELDAATQEHGLAVTGGRMSTTGIAGLTLGGGSGWLERKCGYTVDSLLSVEIVTAHGQLLTASESENPQLFWGLRGGGGNFGVVTNFEFRLHAVGPIVLGGALIYPAQMAADVLRNFREVMAEAPDEVGSAVVLVTAPPEDFIPEPVRGRPICLVGLCHAGPLDAGEEALRPLREFGPPAVDMVAPMPYVEIQRMIDAGSPAGIRNYITADYLSGLGDDALDVMCIAHLTRPSPLTEIVVLPGGGAPARIPGDASAFGLERAAPFNYLIHSKWAGPADDEANIAWTRELATAMKPFGTGRSYLNFIGEEGPDRVVAAFGAKRYARLQALKDRYDPDNTFRLNQNIRPTGAVTARRYPYVNKRRRCNMSVTETQGIRERREAIVREHVEAENRRDIGATIATFDHPRYEVNGEESDGESAVHDLLEELLSAFPDFHAEERRIHHADDAVIAEARVTGTHGGPFGGVPATGRKIDYSLVAIFEFEEDRLVCEKVHFDTAAILRQIGVLPDPGSE